VVWGADINLQPTCSSSTLDLGGLPGPGPGPGSGPRLWSPCMKMCRTLRTYLPTYLGVMSGQSDPGHCSGRWAGGQVSVDERDRRAGWREAGTYHGCSGTSMIGVDNGPSIVALPHREMGAGEAGTRLTVSPRRQRAAEKAGALSFLPSISRPSHSTLAHTQQPAPSPAHLTHQPSALALAPPSLSRNKSLKPNSTTTY
jgi:hypothetical protein